MPRQVEEDVARLQVTVNHALRGIESVYFVTFVHSLIDCMVNFGEHNNKHVTLNLNCRFSTATVLKSNDSL